MRCSPCAHPGAESASQSKARGICSAVLRATPLSALGNWPVAVVPPRHRALMAKSGFETASPFSTDRLGSAKIDCPSYGLSAIGPKFDGEVRLSGKFDRWFGDLEFSAGNVRHAQTTLGAPAGSVSFDGGRERTNLTLSLDRASYRDASLAIRRMSGTAEGRIATT